MTKFWKDKKKRVRVISKSHHSTGTMQTGVAHLSVPRHFTNQPIILKSNGRGLDEVYYKGKFIGSVRKKLGEGNYLAIGLNDNSYQSKTQSNAIRALVLDEKKSTEISENDLLNLALMLPAFQPIKMGLLLLNKIEFFNELIETLVSSESSKKKINTIELELAKQVEGKIISGFSKDSTMKISTLLKEQGYYESVSKELNKNSQQLDADILQNFFENTLEELIEKSIAGVLDND